MTAAAVIAFLGGLIVGANAVVFVGAILAVVAPDHRNPVTRRIVDWIARHSM